MNKLAQSYDSVGQASGWILLNGQLFQHVLLVLLDPHVDLVWNYYVGVQAWVFAAVASPDENYLRNHLELGFFAWNYIKTSPWI